MSPTLSLRRRARPVPADVEVPAQDLPPIADASDQVASTMTTKLASAALIGCLVAGPLGLVAGGLAIAQAAGPTAPAQTQVADQSSERAAAGEFAQRVVLAWLGSTRDHPEQLTGLVQNTQAASLPAVAFGVSDPTVSSIEQVGGIWSVRVAVTVTDQRKTTVRRFFQVPVTLSGGAVTALTLPAPVAGPPIGAGTDLGYQVQVASSGPVASTVTQFLGAYLAGSGDVTRYVSPGVQVAAITPAPYSSVRVTDLRCDLNIDTTATPKDGARLQLLVGADASVTDKQAVSVAYALTLSARAGRWEVSAIDPSPVLAPKSPGAATAPGQPVPSGPATTSTGSTSSATPS